MAVGNQAARLLESGLFAAAFQIGVFVFLLIWPTVVAEPLSLGAIWSMASFAALSLPLVAVVWFLAGSVYEQLSFYMTATIGVICAIIPCVLIVLLTEGMEFFAIAFVLPGALPLSIAVTWLFDRARSRLRLR